MNQFKSKIDSKGNIVVLWLNPGNLHVPGAPEIDDYAMRRGYDLYISGTSEIIKECRRSCFCILVHGNRRELAGMSEKDSETKIIQLYQSYGRGRKLLLLSCLTGMNLARRLAPSLKAEIIAPTGLATITNDGRIICGIPYGYSKEGTKNWMRVTPDGDLFLAGSETLSPTFLHTGYMPDIDIKR